MSGKSDYSSSGDKTRRIRGSFEMEMSQRLPRGKESGHQKERMNPRSGEGNRWCN